MNNEIVTNMLSPVVHSKEINPDLIISAVSFYVDILDRMLNFESSFPVKKQNCD